MNIQEKITNLEGHCNSAVQSILVELVHARFQFADLIVKRIDPPPNGIESPIKLVLHRLELTIHNGELAVQILSKIIDSQSRERTETAVSDYDSIQATVTGSGPAHPPEEREQGCPGGNESTEQRRCNGDDALENHWSPTTPAAGCTALPAVELALDPLDESFGYLRGTMSLRWRRRCYPQSCRVGNVGNRGNSSKRFRSKAS